MFYFYTSEKCIRWKPSNSLGNNKADKILLEDQILQFDYNTSLYLFPGSKSDVYLQHFFLTHIYIFKILCMTLVLIITCLVVVEKNGAKIPCIMNFEVNKQIQLNKLKILK